MRIFPAETDPPEIMPWLWRDIKGGGLAFEVGANQGQSLARLAALFTRVVAFEPYEPSFRMAAGAAAELPGTDVRQMAVSGHDGETALRLVEDQFRTDSHEASSWHRTWHSDPEITVPCVTLDTVAAAEGIPDFVSMDVEGSEADALRGAGTILAAAHTTWFIEFHSRDLRTECLILLEVAARRIETVRHPHYEPGSRLWHDHGWLLAHP